MSDPLRHSGCWRRPGARRSAALTTALLALGSAAGLHAGGGKAEHRLVGSDLFGSDCIAAVVASARADGITITPDLTGSLPGRAALAAGEAGVGLLAGRLDEGPNAPDGWQTTPVAYLATVVLVPAENPISRLSFPELVSIFDPERVPEIRRWGDLGLEGEWTARTISGVAIAPEHSLAGDLFAHVVLDDRPLAPTIAKIEEMDEILARLRGDPSVVALTGIVPAEADVRAVPVAARSDDVAFGPSEENIASGDYPLRLPLFLVYRNAADPAAAAVARFFAGREGVRSLAKAHLIALPEGARARLAATFAAP